jgi:transcriptional regulator GlxA family with amidase domain
VLPPRLTLLDIAGPLEVLRRANREQNNVRFDVHYIGASRSVLTSIGIPVTSIDPLPPKPPDGAMIVVAGDVDKVMMPSNRTHRDTSKTDKRHESAIVEWLRAVVRPGHKLIAICSGALMAGEAGLLDGYTARRTTYAAKSSRQLRRKRKFSEIACMWNMANATPVLVSRPAST